MVKLKKLMKLCNAGISLEINNHRYSYMSAKDYMLEYENNYGESLDIPVDTRKIMEERDIIIMLQFYPKTPVGSYTLYHYDIDIILNKALDILN